MVADQKNMNNGIQDGVKAKLSLTDLINLYLKYLI